MKIKEYALQMIDDIQSIKTMFKYVVTSQQALREEIKKETEIHRTSVYLDPMSSKQEQEYRRKIIVREFLMQLESNVTVTEKDNRIDLMIKVCK